MTRSIRFQPDPLDHALVDFGDGAEFAPSAVALILNESFSGCSLLIKTRSNLSPGQLIKVKVGRLDPLRAKIVWGKVMDEGVFKVGVQFLE